MKRIHPTRKQRRDVNATGWDVPRRYSGRPTRKQRRKEERYLASRRPSDSFQGVNREDVPTLSEMPTPTAEETLGALSAGLGTIEPQEALTCVVDTSTGQTITINGEQVPATIVKDPTK
jgi:hypothetical protein